MREDVVWTVEGEGAKTTSRRRVEVAVAPRSHEVMQEAGSAGEQAGEGQEQLTLAETVP